MSSVLKRKMFMQPPVKKASGGIMTIVGEDEEDSYEDRTPENLEIITNNLRGDVRSMDERYNELAQMVGEEQAAQTPPEVIALLQTKLAPQQPMPPVPASKANGIAGLMGDGEQPPMPGQPPMGGAQPPMPGQPPMPPGQPPMPPGPPPTPTGQPPVQRQKGSPPVGEYTREKGAGYLPGGGMRIDITGVKPEDENTQPRALTPETIGPVTRIPEVIPTTTAPRMGGSSGFIGTQPAQQGPSALDIYNMENAQAAPPLKSATDFVEGYASQGGDLQDLAKYLSQPEPDFQESNNIIGNYLQDLSKQAPNQTTQQPSSSGIESLVNEPQAPTIPQEDLSTIEDVSRNIGQQETPAQAPQEAPAPAQAPQEAPAPAQTPQKAPAQRSRFSMPSISGDALAGIGAALAIGGLLGKAKGKIDLSGLGGGLGGGGDKDTGMDKYLRLLAFASPHRSAEQNTGAEEYLELFGKTPGEKSAPESMLSGLSKVSDVQTKQPSNVEVFPIEPPNIGVKSLAPQQPVQRQTGSPPVGERVEPVMRITDVINQERGPARGTPKFVQQLQAEGVVPTTPDNTPKSRPLTQDELAGRVAAGERRTMSPATRTLYELSRQMGIDPNILTDRLNKFSNVMKKVPGVGKFFKGIEVFDNLSTGSYYRWFCWGFICGWACNTDPL